MATSCRVSMYSRRGTPLMWLCSRVLVGVILPTPNGNNAENKHDIFSASHYDFGHEFRQFPRLALPLECDA